MKLFLLILTGVFALVSITYGLLSSTKKCKSGRILADTSFCCTYLLGFFIAFLLANTLEAKGIFYSLELATSDWVYFCMLCLVCEGIDRPLKKSEATAFASLFLIDSLVYITNQFNQFAVQFTPDEKFGGLFVNVNMGVFGVVHYVLCYAACLFMVVCILWKIIRVSKYYRAKYFVVLVALAFIVAFDIVFTVSPNSKLDITKYLSVIAVVAAYHSTFSFSPLKLLKSLQIYVNDNVSDATIIYDNVGGVLSVNKQAKELLPDNVWESGDKLYEYLGFPDEGRFKKTIKTGVYEVLYKPVYDSKESLVAKTFIFYDITDLERSIEREHNAAITDRLTGCYNRNGFFEAAHDFLYKNEFDAGFALIVSGIRAFKAINSSYGSSVGDMVLKHIERCYHEYHHNYPMIYGRTAEGKFSVIVPFDYVDEIAADMTSMDVNVGDDAYVHVEMCHGFIVLDDFAKPLDYYYERALIALAECKKKAARGALEYSFAMEEKIQRSQQLIAGMHDALRNEEFFVELQPQINLLDRSVSGAEALVRWKHPTLGRISPAEFIPIFESNGFIVNLDVYVWEKAARIARELSDEGIYKGPISINVSQIDIMNMDVVSKLEKIVNEVGIEPSRLHVEITESACADRRESLVKTMELLRKKGFILEIDDFGSGYSSLNALMHLPFDIIKLDMAFMKESSLEGKNGVILGAMMDMIHSLNAEIIVEGVETEDNVENTVRFGGDVAQGYYFSRPLGIESFKEYVLMHKR